ncbi:hypothetical protein H4O11_08365 [Stenotrophomonas tumulicola]|uniref:Uncharacterized protein n=1 Tax=Stenotrophomonas tumulicola TaxID=1685415 RepID=A0A7W3FLM6_9GAMM|nr:hypothetical protein [Stenotrophomonas tumulicola]
MALPVPSPAHRRSALQGWPILVAGLLALLLGWCALHDGQASPARAGGHWALDAGMPAPQGTPPAERIATVAEAEAGPAHGGKPAALTCAARPGMQATLVAKATAWPLQALRLRAGIPRRPPGQAPPPRA